MTKQDFELIASVLRERFQNTPSYTAQHVISCVARDFARELATTNPRFDRGRFIAACMGEDSHDSAGRRVRYSEM